MNEALYLHPLLHFDTSVQMVAQSQPSPSFQRSPHAKYMALGIYIAYGPRKYLTDFIITHAIMQMYK